MEFDKSRILTVVTADQAKVGQKGWFGETPSALEKRVEKEPPKVLESVCLSGDRRYIFRTNDDSWSLFYPAPEPTYAERQARWVKENNVKAGTKVRVTRTFTDDEDGSCCWEYDDLVGMTGVVYNIYSHNFGVDMSDGNIRAIPYFALEVIKEPTYRPFANAEEFKPYRDEWFRIKRDGAMIRCSAYNDEGVQDTNGTMVTYKPLFENVEFENGEPCGMEEK
jgi:hypothetical protein